MSERRAALAVGALTLALAGCADAASEPAAVDEERVSQAAIEAIKAYHAQWEVLDFDAIAAHHSPDFEYVFFDQVLEADAFPAILSEQWMQGVARYSIDESEFRPLVLSPSEVYVTVAIVDDTVYEDGSTAQTEGVMSYLLTRDEEWKVRRIHHSGPPPGDLYEGTSPAASRP